MKKITDLIAESTLEDQIKAVGTIYSDHYYALATESAAAFIPIMCTLLDEWSSRHDADPVEVSQFIADYVKQINAELGRMEV